MASKPENANPNLSYVNSVMQDVRKQTKHKLLMLSDAVDAAVTFWFKTGFPHLDKALGGGMPGGRCCEISGWEACGKSALANQMAVIHTRLGGLVVIIDTENSNEKKKLLAAGAKPEFLIVHRPRTHEEGWAVVWSIIRSIRGKQKKDSIPPLFIWDSIAAGRSAAQLKGSSGKEGAGKGHVGGLALVTAQNILAMYDEMASVNGQFVFVNQLRKGRGGFIPQDKTVGADAIKFACSVRMRMKAYPFPLKSMPKTGYMVFARVDKNKVAPPFKTAAWILDFERGPSVELTAFEILCRKNRIKPSKKQKGKLWCKWHPPFTKEKFMEMMENNPAFRGNTLEALTDCGPVGYMDFSSEGDDGVAEV